MCDEPVRYESVPWRPFRQETKLRIYRSWYLVLTFDAGNWSVGFGFDVAPTGFAVGVGPFSIGLERDEPSPDYNSLPDWGRTLYRLVIRIWKLDIRLQFDLNLWQIGYAMADIHDHGIYAGPFNVQIEYDKLYNEPNGLFFH
jgi:hypothetical protein